MASAMTHEIASFVHRLSLSGIKMMQKSFPLALNPSQWSPNSWKLSAHFGGTILYGQVPMVMRLSNFTTLGPGWLSQQSSAWKRILANSVHAIELTYLRPIRKVIQLLVKAHCHYLSLSKSQFFFFFSWPFACLKEAGYACL